MKHLTKIALMAGVCLLPAAMWAQDAPTDEQVRAAALAAAKGLAPVKGAGTMVGAPLAKAVSQGAWAAGPALAPNFITVGEYLGPFLTPCFGCLTTTSSFSTLGLTLPMAVIPAGVPQLQFTYLFEDMTYTGTATAALVVMQGTKVVLAKAFSGAIQANFIWAIDFNEPTPAVTGPVKVFGIVLYGTFSPKALVEETPLIIQ